MAKKSDSSKSSEVSNEVSEVITIGQSDRSKYNKKLSQMGDGKIGDRLSHLIKSRYKILYIRSEEEMRVIQCLSWISLIYGYDIYQWDCSRGLLDTHSMQQIKSANSEVHSDPSALLGHIVDQAKNDNQKIRDKKPKGEGHIYVLLDFHPFLRDNPDAQRKMKEFFNITSVCCVVIISPVWECPETLNKEFTLVDFPLPSRHEIREALFDIKQSIPDKYPHAIKFAEQHEEELLDAAAGLTVVEAENAYALSLVSKKSFDISMIADEKRQIIKKSGILEFRDPRFNFDEVGGLENLKLWLDHRKMAFSSEAREFGLSLPKGVLLTGIPGTGKSMVAESLALHWQMPLLRLDIGSVFSPHIGDSEKNIRDVVRISESVAPCLLWVDEIEKGLGGVQSSNQTDGGVTNRVFGTLLTWMQEKESAVFVICTANNVCTLPPELMRAGRFDEIFFLDLPNAEQRVDVLEKLLLKKFRNPEEFDLDKIAQASENYSPAELEKSINNALFVAYYDNKRQLTDADIINALNSFQPLYNSRREEIQELRDWAIGDGVSGGRAVLANSIVSTKNHLVHKVSRKINLSEIDV